MGCTTSRAAGNKNVTFSDISKPGQDFGIEKKEWKTIRVYVSSTTFEDFHHEREVLQKKVFPDLWAWCESRRLSLAEVDLIWGVPKDSNNELAMRACLEEIDRSYQENEMPFFLNMTSERIGWVPQDEIPEAVKTEYKWIEGLSATEMKLVQAAYRNDNPNALFMLRDPSFLAKVPENQKKHFVDSQEIEPPKIDILNEMITDKFPNDRVKRYEVEYVGYNEASKMVEMEGLEDTFYNEVTAFLQERIEKQYQLEGENLDPYQQARYQHESFMKSRCDTFFGRQKELYKIENHIIPENDVPLLVVGGDGVGKSSLLAKVADVATARALEGLTPERSCSESLLGSRDSRQCHVFYHFAGAVPGSTDLLGMLRRFLNEMKVVDESSMPKDLNQACELTYNTLADPNTKSVIMIVDALDKFEEDKAVELVSWVPKKLAPHVRCVFSMIPGTKRHRNLDGHGPEPRVLKLSPLTKKTRKAIVNELLDRHNKRLGDDQMRSLLKKKSSKNPLWLSIACEELRFMSHYKEVSDKINQLADRLPRLQIQVLDRLEKENGGELLKATLCLLEVSARGLLEEELLALLADHNTVSCETDGEDRRESKRELPANKWATVYRALRPFLRPFGEGWEGRMEFYYRSLSAAVKKKYFSKMGKKGGARLSWHRKLADFFNGVSTNFTRKVEELPIHLIAIKDKARLEAFLTDWDVMKELFDMDYSYKLLTYWRLGSDFESLQKRYTTLVDEYTQWDDVDEADKVDKYELVARILAQVCCFKEGTRLCKEAMDIARNELGSRPHKMTMLYYLEGVLVDDAMKLEEYRNKGQLSRMKSAIDSYVKAKNEIEKMRDEDKEKYKTTLGRIHNRLAFLYIGYSLRGGDKKLPESEATDEAEKSVKEATAIFKELGDSHNIAYSKVVQGVCSWQLSKEEQIQCYKEAEELAIRASGPLNTIMDRLYLNMGIYYEDAGDYNRAYECFYKRFVSCRDFFGTTHPKISRTITTLREDRYKWVARKNLVKIPPESKIS